MSDAASSGQQVTWLDRIPMPALLLSHDGSTARANSRWAALSPVAAGSEGWFEVIEPTSRPALRAMLRLAATTAEPGRADCPVVGPRGGRWSRWWWQPFPPGGLVVCVLVINDGPADGLPAARDARGLRAAGEARLAVSAGIGAELATVAVHRILEAGVALQSAAGSVPEPAATLVLRVLDDLDHLVGDIRAMAFKSQTRPPIWPPEGEE